MFRKNHLIPILLIILCSATIFGQGQKSRAKVLVLGTFHFNNPGLDIANTNVDNVLAPKRQEEIKEIVNLLKKFQPTKIAVEAEFGSPTVKHEYAKYIEGEYNLTPNEIDQIGYRLAKDLGHKEIYPIDWKGNFDFDKVIAYAKENGQADLTDSFIKTAELIAKKTDKDLQTKTIREILSEMNSSETLDRFHNLYLSLSRVGKDKNYTGTDLLSDWFERNLKIYTNITRISKENDRILVIIGASHAPILQRFLRDSNFEVVLVKDFL